MQLCLLKEAEAPCRSEGCAYQPQEEEKVQPAPKHCGFPNAGNKHHNIITQQHLPNSACILNMILGKELQLLKRFHYNMQFYSLAPKDHGRTHLLCMSKCHFPSLRAYL